MGYGKRLRQGLAPMSIEVERVYVVVCRKGISQRLQLAGGTNGTM
jgi:hypothetical protein